MGQLLPVEAEAKKHAVIAYIFMVIGSVTGLFSVFGLIWAMVKRDEAVGTRFYDHYSNIITVFWVGLAFKVVGLLLAIVMIGYFVLFVGWVWELYRLVKGLDRISKDQAYR